MKVTDFINGKVTFDEYGSQHFWINCPDGSSQMLAEIRGWGAIQNLFKTKGGMIEVDSAAKFQDEVGQWIAEAINEKLEREAKKS